MTTLPDGLDALLDLQRGALTRRQALEHGLTGPRIDRLVRAKQWQRVHRGVLVAFSGAIPFDARAWAAVLYAGTGASLVLQTAAFLDGLCEEPGPVLHVGIPAARRVRKTAGVQLHIDCHLEEKVHPARLPPRTITEATVVDLVDAAATPSLRAHIRRSRSNTYEMSSAATGCHEAVDSDDSPDGE